MNDEAIHGDPIVKSNEFSPNDEHRGVFTPDCPPSPKLEEFFGNTDGQGGEYAGARSDLRFRH